MSDEAAALRDQVELLRRSLDDARHEHAVGDLDDVTLAMIVERDTERLDDARARLASLEALGASPAAVPRGAQPSGTVGRPRRRRSLVVVAAACLAIVVGVVLVAAVDPFAAPKAPPKVTRAERLDALLVAAEVEVSEHQPLRALTAYDAVLRLDARNAEALIESGWLRYEEGLGLHRPAWVIRGAATLRRAVEVAPDAAAAHLYDGIVLFQHDHDTRGALAQIRRAFVLPETAVEQSLTWYFLGRLDRA